MEVFTQHIEQLLKQHDCVIIPDFGGFIVNQASAVVDTANNTIKAPQKVIYFNPALKYNDGLLAGTIRLAENQTFRKANEVIAEQVEQIRQSLYNGDTISFGKIGTLTMNNQGQIDFIPAASFNFLPDNIGTYDIHFNTLRAKHSAKKQIVLQLPSDGHHFYKYAVACAIGLLMMMIAPALQQNTSSNLARMYPLCIFSSRQATPSGSSNKALVHSSLPLVVNNDAAADGSWHVVVGSFPTQEAASKKMKEFQNEAGLTTGIYYASKLISNPPSSYATNPVAAAPVKSPSPITPNTLPTHENVWHVVVADFETPRKAKKYLELMSKIDKTPLAIFGKNNIYRIVAGSYTNSEDAWKRIYELRNNPNFTGIWVLHNPSLYLHPVSSPFGAQVAAAFEKTSPATTTPITSGALPTNENVWHVVVANFETPKKAKNFVALMSRTNKTPLAIFGHNNVYRILAGSYSNREEAWNKMQEMQNHADFREAWVLHDPSLHIHPVSSPITAPAAPEHKTNTLETSTMTFGHSSKINYSSANNPTWYVVVANFETQKDAQKYIELIGQTDKTPLAILNENNAYHVIAASCTTEDAMVAKMKELQRHTAFRSAWILYCAK